MRVVWMRGAAAAVERAQITMRHIGTRRIATRCIGTRRISLRCGCGPMSRGDHGVPHRISSAPTAGKFVHDELVLNRWAWEGSEKQTQTG